ncbi:MAG: DHA2 family efflux MFS transporter permease subunit [Planctomycetota bacterium]
MSGSGASHTAYHAPSNPWLIAVVATLATFMEVLDTSIANVSLPHIAGNLGASVNDSTWVLTSYLVANAVVLPATAFLASVLGRRTYYLVSVAVFTVSSLLCGVAPDLPSLVAFRLLQGLGGGGLQPLTQAILVDTFPPRMRGMGMAVYGMTVVVAPVIGPTLGGWITDNYSWRWVFLINVPVGAMALWLNHRLLSDPPYLRRRLGPDRWRGDFVGLGLVALGLGCVQLVLDLGEREDWFASNWISIAAIVAVVGLVAGVWWSLRQRDPMVNLRVLRDRNLALSCVHMLVFGAVLYGTTALLPMMLQTQFGYTAMQSGMALSPGGLVVAALMPFVGFMVTRVDARWMVLFGVCVISSSLLLMAGFSPGVDFRTVVTARMLQGFGLAFIFVPINTIAYAHVGAAERNAASSLVNIARNIGGSVGIGYTSTMVARGLQAHRAHLAEHVSLFDPNYGHAAAALQPRLLHQVGDAVHTDLLLHRLLEARVQHQAGVLAYLDEFRFLAVAFLVLVPIVLVMRRHKAAHAEPVAE